MKFNKKENAAISLLMMSVSVICVALAGLGYLWQDVWLASTQWMLTAVVFGLFGVYLKMDGD
ncbi:MAG: hypothetical protein US95_C0063G0014 [Candidatus Woesebacteria bacterium GW2011_GWB1_38_5]|uniref:Uncharacterized protein n=1 Tax=Candidatus Woesebacteria bacterium GW2011_GWB1_38_5 TaxID=1618568 RepID=A0A0G0MG20_9BACT|nr:MAG: hypothetical protein US95_C0063G0014 [Candidatus Woesebacteria bacterium GW2011_GWB1_38_5]